MPLQMDGQILDSNVEHVSSSIVGLVEAVRYMKTEAADTATTFMKQKQGDLFPLQVWL